MTSPVGSGQPGDRPRNVSSSRLTTETKPAFQTTEFIAYIVILIAIVITAFAVGGDPRGYGDPFGAEQALRYITFLTIGYMLSRGLAKAGSWDRGEDVR
ncbi:MULTISPECIES: hypothetical protein [unclassified Streptosporangium]|uniref:hypothetical protein n=1 Tax=unclassified Streptosporangium TaxID=2632669 RepID=UPI002E2B6FB3|nr:MULTISPECIES: hypothetical protein [unclassified Streptosporangium]